MLELQVYPPLPTLDEQVQKYIKKIDAVTSARLLRGFEWKPPVECLSDELKTKLGENIPNFKFSTKISDQVNITQAAVEAGQALAAGNMEWKRAFQGWYEGVQYTLTFGLTDWATFTNAYGVCKDGLLSQGWVWKNKLREQTMPDTVSTVFKSFGLSDEEIAEAEAMVDASL